jgi:hypothetical protein
MDKEQRRELLRSFLRNLRDELGRFPREKWLAVVYLLAFLSVLSAIAALIWLM